MYNKSDLDIYLVTFLIYHKVDRKAQDSSKNTRCDHGEWNPAAPKCIPNMMFGQRNYTQETYASNIRKSCGSPPKDLLAITYNEGIPLDFEKNHRYLLCIFIFNSSYERYILVMEDI